MLTFSNFGEWVEGIGLVNDAWGIEYSIAQGSLSGRIKFICLSADSVSYPCTDAYVIAINENKSIEASVYPNPISKGQFINILSNLPALQNATARMYNPLGQLVLQENIAFVDGRAQLDLSTFVSGSFVLEVKTATHVFYEKIIIQ